MNNDRLSAGQFLDDLRNGISVLNVVAHDHPAGVWMIAFPQIRQLLVSSGDLIGRN